MSFCPCLTLICYVNVFKRLIFNKLSAAHTLINKFLFVSDGDCQRTTTGLTAEKRNCRALTLISQTLTPLQVSETSRKSGQENGRIQRARGLLQKCFGNDRNVANMNSKCLAARPYGLLSHHGYRKSSQGLNFRDRASIHVAQTPEASPSSMYI